jgi:small subunit ribosomal protein S9
MPTKETATLKYIEAVGRRKTAVARVRLTTGSGEILVNDKKIEAYFFDISGGAQRIKAILKKADVEGKIDTYVKVKSGGRLSQLGAVSHGLSRALVKKDAKLKKILKLDGLLTRDPRMKERKKCGLKGARKAPQFSKR